CDIHDATYSMFRDAKIWGTLLVIGYGVRAHCVDLQTRVAHTHTLTSNFYRIYTAGDYCLVASSGALLRLERDGTALWRSGEIALDGVEVSEVTSETIRGQVELDPPGG